MERLAAGVGPVAAAWPPLALSLRGSGAFPGVLWIGLAGDLADLDRLARAARRAVRAAGVAVERRPYRPHLTVARSRQPAAAALNATRDRLGAYAGPAFTVDALRLVRRTQAPQPRYEQVAAWPLGGRSGRRNRRADPVGDPRDDLRGQRRLRVPEPGQLPELADGPAASCRACSTGKYGSASPCTTSSGTAGGRSVAADSDGESG